MKQNTRMSKSMLKLQPKIYGYERKAFPCSFSHDSQIPDFIYRFSQCFGFMTEGLLSSG